MEDLPEEIMNLPIGTLLMNAAGRAWYIAGFRTDGVQGVLVHDDVLYTDIIGYHSIGKDKPWRPVEVDES